MNIVSVNVRSEDERKTSFENGIVYGCPVLVQWKSCNIATICKFTKNKTVNELFIKNNAEVFLVR